MHCRPPAPQARASPETRKARGSSSAAGPGANASAAALPAAMSPRSVETEGARAVDRRHPDDPRRRNGGPLRDAARRPPRRRSSDARWPGCRCRGAEDAGRQEVRHRRASHAQRPVAARAEGDRARRARPAGDSPRRRRCTQCAQTVPRRSAPRPSRYRPRSGPARERDVPEPAPAQEGAPLAFPGGQEGRLLARLREMDGGGAALEARARSSSGETECGAWAARRISTFGAGRGPPASSRRWSASARILGDAAGSQPSSSWKHHRAQRRRGERAAPSAACSRRRRWRRCRLATSLRRSRGRCRRPPRRR